MQQRSRKPLNKAFHDAKRSILQKDIYLAVTIAVLLIISGVFLSWYNNKVVPINSDVNATYQSEPSNPLKFMSNWDGPDYLQIAQSGYTDIGQVNFFPLYPLLIHAINFVIGSLVDSALLISWLCLIGVIYFYLKIIGVLFKEKGIEAVRATMLLVLFPTAVFFLATYTESLFAFLALGSIYFTLKRKYAYAALMALPMSATHVTALFVLALIGLIMLEDKVKLTKIVAVVASGCLGLASYMFYLQEKFKQPLSFITSQKDHGWLSTHYAGLTNIDFYNIVFIALIIIAAIYWWRKRLSFAIYSLSFLLIPIVGQQYGGFNRYVLMVFPVPLMLYSVSKKRPNLYVAIIILTCLSWTYFMLQYAGGYVGG